MADFVETWDETKPDNDTPANQIDDEIQSCRAGIKERLQENMFFDENITKGEHDSDGNFKKLPLSNSEAVNSGITDAVILHAKDADSKAELFVMDEDDNDVQLTRKGHHYCGEEAIDTTQRNLQPGGSVWASENNLSIEINAVSGQVWRARMALSCQSSDTTGRIRIYKTAGTGAASIGWGPSGYFSLTVTGEDGFLVNQYSYNGYIEQFFHITGTGTLTLKLQAYGDYTYTIKDRYFLVERII